MHGRVPSYWYECQLGMLTRPKYKFRVLWSLDGVFCDTCLTFFCLDKADFWWHLCCSGSQHHGRPIHPAPVPKASSCSCWQQPSRKPALLTLTAITTRFSIAASGKHLGFLLGFSFSEKVKGTGLENKDKKEINKEWGDTSSFCVSLNLWSISKSTCAS